VPRSVDDGWRSKPNSAEHRRSIKPPTEPSVESPIARGVDSVPPSTKQPEGRGGCLAGRLRRGAVTMLTEVEGE